MSYSKRLYEKKHYGRGRSGVPYVRVGSPLSPQKTNGTRSKTLQKNKKSNS
jgi:hypothetical protein